MPSLVRPLTILLCCLATCASACAASARTQWLNNLKNIGLGIIAYHDKYRRLPTDIVDAQGKPLLSWRVAILPFVDQKKLYAQFHLDEPWDSPHNLELARQHTVGTYAHPSKENPELAYFAMPKGPGTYFGDDPLALFRHEFKNVASAIMIVELDDDAAVLWSRPDTWQYNPERPLDGIPTYRLRSGAFSQFGRACVFWDGSVCLLPAQPDQMRALFAADPSESHAGPLSWDDLLSSDALLPALAPLVIFTVIVTVWSCVLISCLFRGKAVTCGECLLLTLAPQLLSIVVGFFLLYQPPEIGVDAHWPSGHVSILAVSRFGGVLACLMICIFKYREKSARVAAIVAGVLLCIGLYAILRDPPAPVELDDADVLVSGISPAVPLVAFFTLFASAISYSEGIGRLPPGQRVRHVLALVLCILPIVSCVYWGGTCAGIDWPGQRVRS